LKAFGEWTDRLAKGGLPKTIPPRPQEIERNVVVTTSEWGLSGLPPPNFGPTLKSRCQG
jgi:hypothetical protein